MASGGDPSISADGRFVAFTSRASNLGPGKKRNGYNDIFVRDRQTRTTRQMNVGLGGFQANAGSHGSSISADGRFVAFDSDATNPDRAWLRLGYSVNGTPVAYRIELATTRPTYGGQRWWFICPLQHRDGDPPRRVTKLYLPLGERYFGSRAGYGLTYTSCQESGQFQGLFRQLAIEMGMDEKAVRAALTDG